MAEDQDSSQEKTEEATPKRLEKAREEGQIPRSKELNTMAVLLAGSGGLLMFGEKLGKAFETIMVHSFSLSREVLMDTAQMGLFLLFAAKEAAWAMVPLLILLLVAAIVGPIGLGGWLFSSKALAPKFSRLNPLSGLKRMFSLNALVELAKAVAKVSVVMVFAVLILDSLTGDLLSMGLQATIPAMAHATDVLAWSFFLLSCTTIVIAFVDVPFQIYEHQKKLKMTKQQVKDEYKDTEGKPEVKGRIRQLQREMAQRRMMLDVPKADVVITNPTHFSVALKYDENSMGAPILLAKGGDEIAMKIREIAREHGVELVEAPPLARSIYYHTEIGAEIPSGLYMAVAQVLAYVFQLRQYRRGYHQKPKKPDFPIPNDLRRDE